MRRTQKKEDKPGKNQPRFVISLVVEEYVPGRAWGYVSPREVAYYATECPWRLVPKSRATWLNHKAAVRIANYLSQHKIGYVASVEELP